MSKSGNDRVLVITQYSLPDHKRNMNAYQRNYYGSEYAEIHLLLRRRHTVSHEISQRVKVHRAPVENRLLFFLYAICFGLLMRFAGVDVVLTEPSKYALVGFVLKYAARYFWVMDVWDPVWKERPESGHRIKMSDRLAFWIMRRADLFILSCLPRAVKHVRPDPNRCVQLFNAIDLANMADAPPHRSEDAPMLELALARAKLSEKEGLHVVLKAAEKISQTNIRNVPVRIHLVGNLDEGVSQLLANSPASDLFQIHGFISQSRCDFFRSIHVGLVPYLDYEDMSYIFPIKVLEHLSQGNAVIASNVPGLASMIEHEYNGLLFEPGNSDDLARCILRLHDDLALWRRLSLNAMQSVRKFDVVDKNRTIFEQIKKGKNGGVRQS